MLEHYSTKERGFWVCEMAQQVKLLSAKPDDESSNPTMHMVRKRTPTAHKVAYDFHLYALACTCAHKMNSCQRKNLREHVSII